MLCMIGLVVLTFSNIVVGEYGQSVLQCAARYAPVECLIGTDESPAKSCDEILATNPYAKSGVFKFVGEEESTYTGYCEFGKLGACGEGPWNLVMRTDGSKSTFQYTSKLWTSKEAYYEKGAAEGPSGRSEMKLRSYWSAAVKRICIGMNNNGDINWVELPVKGDSLYDLISGGKELATKLGRSSWKSLIKGSSLQRKCNHEGINAQTNWMKARFGIIGNQENNCGTPDSFLGIGISDTHHRSGINTGNYAGGWNPDNGVRRTKTIGIVLVKSVEKFHVGTPENPASTCDDVKAFNTNAKSGVYHFQGTDGSVFSGYCQFGSLGNCGEGPWNLVMRTDGSKNTFEYSSNQWTSKGEYNQAAAHEGIGGNSEMKLHSYSSAAVESICIGMRVGGRTNWLKIPVSGASLYDLLAGGKQRRTSVSRNAWKSLIDNSSLQRHCSREGLNAQTNWMKARFGIIGNQENNCGTPDSFLGIGISDTHHRSGIKTGNYAGGWNPDNGVRRTKTIGLVLVKSPPILME